MAAPPTGRGQAAERWWRPSLLPADSSGFGCGRGTGTPEVGGPNSFQALEVVRALAGLDIVGADLVEVSPPFDASGATAYLGASIMFELLCMMV